MSKTEYKIAHILPWPTVGGTEQATLRIAQAVEEAHFKSVAFCLQGHSPVKELFLAVGIETVDYIGVEPSYRHPSNYLINSVRLAREFKARNVDIVHCADLLAGHTAALAGKLANLPVICQIRNRYEQISRRDRSFLWTINKFVFVSQDTWNRFGYKVSLDRGVVVYDGIEVGEKITDEMKQEVRREFDIQEHLKIIGMVARVAPQKDYTTLAKAAALIVKSNPDVHFLIVGDHAGADTYREHYEEVKQLLSSQGLLPYFTFTGQRSDVPRLIAAMDLFVLSTHWEGLPLVILEGMAQAKPVVATAVDGIPEVVVDGKTGFLYPHQNEKQLADKLLSLLKDERLATSMGEAGYRLLQSNFSQQQFARNMVRVYQEAVGVGPNFLNQASQVGFEKPLCNKSVE